MTNDIDTVFCYNCRKDVSYTTEETEMMSMRKGLEYHYMAKKAYCDKCGSEVYVASYNDNNLDALYAAYRTER